MSAETKLTYGLSLDDINKGRITPDQKEASLFWFKRLDLDSFLAWLSLQCKYGKIAEFEVDVSGKYYSVTLHHALGEKYSLALANWCDQALRTIAHVAPKLVLSKNSVMMSFDAPR